MKKKILGFALVAMSFVGFTAMAQTTPDPTAPRQENVREKKADKKERRQQVNPFEGMTLTDSQQAQLQQLDSKRQAGRAKKMTGSAGTPPALLTVAPPRSLTWRK